MFVLSIKKLKENINHSVVFIICIVLLCILIILLGNICVYMQVNVRRIVWEEVSTNGLDLEIRATENTISLPLENIKYVIDKVEGINGKFAFSAEAYSEVELDGIRIDCKPYFEYGMLDSIQVLSGENISRTANNKDYIWLSQKIEGYMAGQYINLNLNGIEKTMTIKGIVEGNVSYIDYGYFDIKILYCNNLSDDIGWNSIKKLAGTIDDISEHMGINDDSEKYVVSSSVFNTYKYLNVINLFSSGVCVGLIIIVIALSVIGLINTVKINTNVNQKFFGMLMMQGIDKRSLMMFYFYQYIIYIGIGVAVASIVSAIILKMSLNAILGVFFGLLGYFDGSFVIGFSWWLPLVCVAVMVFICLAVAAKETKRISKKEIANLLKGDV